MGIGSALCPSAATDPRQHLRVGRGRGHEKRLQGVRAVVQKEVQRPRVRLRVEEGAGTPDAGRVEEARRHRDRLPCRQVGELPPHGKCGDEDGGRPERIFSALRREGSRFAHILPHQRLERHRQRPLHARCTGAHAPGAPASAWAAGLRSGHLSWAALTALQPQDPHRCSGTRRPLLGLLPRGPDDGCWRLSWHQPLQRLQPLQWGRQQRQLGSRTGLGGAARARAADRQRRRRQRLRDHGGAAGAPGRAAAGTAAWPIGGGVRWRQPRPPARPPAEPGTDGCGGRRRGGRGGVVRAAGGGRPGAVLQPGKDSANGIAHQPLGRLRRPLRRRRRGW
mmetsp:Transcript_13746/g.48509  ORF Transcript_13746/g.48509 Transcript_13746/m.48509 type:complete len:336 (+) Transcript_13746:1244-2251(+)